MFRIKPYIKYEASRDKNFFSEIKKRPGCENLSKCVQCGACSGICPLSIYMDITPRRVIELTRSGFKKEVLSSFTIWLCSSCYACVAECPKQIGITDVMYALKQKAIRDKAYPKNFPIAVLAREFFHMVSQKGRITESHLVLRVFLKALFFKLFKMQKLGFNLLRTGRFSLKSASIKQTEAIKKLLDDRH